MPILWILITLFTGLVGGAAGLYAGTTLLRRAVREVQYGLADLEDRFLREVKKRAAAARWEEAPATQTLPEALKGAFLSPGEFARRKSVRRMTRGTQSEESPSVGS